MFKTGTWVTQRNSEYENTYALVVGYSKHGKTECIAIQDFRPIAKKCTLNNWYPQPVKINVLAVPVPLRRKVEAKQKTLKPSYRS